MKFENTFRQERKNVPGVKLRNSKRWRNFKEVLVLEDRLNKRPVGRDEFEHPETDI